MVKFLFDYKFHVAKFYQYEYDKPYGSPMISSFYNNVALYWKLIIFPNGGKMANDVKSLYSVREYRSNIGLFLKYKDGPQKEITGMVKFYVLKDGSRLFCCSDKLLKYFGTDLAMRGCFPNALPTDIQALVDRNCLSDMDTMLHIQAELEIPAEAFYDPTKQYPGIVAMSDSVDFCQTFLREQFESINNEVDDDDDRFEMISKDKRHFWVHKYIMTKRSPVFKAMFKSDAGKEGGMFECYNKSVSIDVSGVALEQALQYMYMGFVNKMSYNTIKDVLLFASMHFLDDLKAICVQKLLSICKSNDLSVDQVLDMSMISEKHELKDVKECCISFLTNHWIDAIDKGCFMPNRVFTDQQGKAFLKDLFTNIQKKMEEQ